MKSNLWLISPNMQCPVCGHGKLHKHGRTRKGRQRFKCPKCQQTFTESFDTIDYRRQVSQQEGHKILQSHSEGSSLGGVSRISCGLILSSRVGKHTDELAVELIVSTEGKTNCTE